MDGVGNKMAKKPKTAATFKSDLGGLHRSFVDICNTPKVVTKWVLEEFQKLAYQKLGREYVDQFALQFVTKVRHWIRELGKYFDDDAERMLKTISPAG